MGDPTPDKIADSAALIQLAETNPHYVLQRLQAAWERFVNDGVLAESGSIRAIIADRWRRCQELGLDPHANRAPEGISSSELEEILHREDVATAGKSVLDVFAPMVEDTGHIIVLADALGRILYAAGDPKVKHRLAQINFAPGGLWAEAAVGPNGVGTPIALGSPTFVFGPEHFCEGWQPWVCYGSPIRDLTTGKIVGGVDISGPARRLERSTFELAISLARSIEKLLPTLGVRRRYLLFEEFFNVQRHLPNDGLILLDHTDRVVEMNSKALAILRRDFRVLMGRPIHETLPQLGMLVDTVASPAGTATETRLDFVDSDGKVVSCYAQIRSVVKESRFIGTLVNLRPVAAPRHPASGAPSPVRRFDASDVQSSLASFDQILGSSTAIQETRRLAAKAAATDKTVLLVGESGTGKELVAQAIHSASPRSGGPFLPVNCAALPHELADAELFGYAPGSFTGARRDGNAGKFELAAGGTLFLDEIDSMPLELQAKLLRALETRRVMRLGGREFIDLDVRVIGAASQDLATLVQQGRFRLDLYYRLNVFEIRMPPLRERADDILYLATRFLDEECHRIGRGKLRLSDEVVEALRVYTWPGNVRELRNVCERWACVVEGDEVRPEHLPDALRPDKHARNVRPVRSGTALEDLTLELIESTLRQNGGNVGETARQIGISRTTIYRKLRKAGRL